MPDIATQLAELAKRNKKIKLLTRASRRIQVAAIDMDTGAVTRELVESWAIMEDGSINPMVVRLDMGLVLADGVIVDLDWPADKISDEAIRAHAGWTALETP